MERIVVDVQTGVQTIVPLTAEEIAALEAQAAANPPPPPPAQPSLADLKAQLDAIQAQINAML